MREILDQYGNPFKKSELHESQTAKSAHLSREFESHPSAGMTPKKLFHLLTGAEQGDLVSQAELGMDMMEKNAHLFAEMSKRIRFLAGLPWSIQPPRDASAAEKKEAIDLQEQLEDRDDLPDVIFHLGDALLHGYSNIEMEWQLDGKRWVPTFHHRPATWFTVAPDARDTLLLRSMGAGYGEPLQPFGWISHIAKAKSGYLTRAGLVRVLAWPYLFMNYAARDLAELLEILGIPIGLAKYPRGATDEEKSTLLNALLSIGHSARGIIPLDMELDFLAAANGNHEPFEVMIGWGERSISKAILAGTLTSNSGAGTNTNALGNVHERGFKDLIESDAKQAAATLSRDLIYPLRVLNGHGDPSRPFRFVFDLSEPEDLKPFVEAIGALVEKGGASLVPEEWFHERSGIPIPATGERTLADALAKPEPIALPPKEKDSPSEEAPEEDKTKEQAGLSQQVRDERDEFDAVVDELTGDWERVIAPMVNPVLAGLDEAVEAGLSLEQFRDQLPGLIKQIELKPLTDRVHHAMFSAHAYGRSGASEADG